MQEFKRLFNRRFLILFAILLGFNAFLIINTNYSEAQNTRKYYEIISAAKNYKTPDNSNRAAMTVAIKNAFPEGAEIDRALINSLLEYADYIDNFSQIIADRIDNATQLAMSSLYQEVSFERRNILKSRYDLIQLSDATPELSNGKWLEQLLNYNYIQIFIIIILLVTVYHFFDDRNGLCYIIRASANARYSLICKRLGVILSQAILASVIFYLQSAIILLAMYGGLEDIGKLALSDEALILTAMKLTRLQLLLILVLISALFSTAIAIFLWLILMKFANVKLGVFVFGLIGAFDILMYFIIDEKNPIRFLHYINIFYLISPNNAVQYSNWGYAFGIETVLNTSAIFAIMLLIVSIGIILFWEKNNYYSRTGNFIENILEKISELNMRIIQNSPQLIKELYKILISQKSLIILGILIIISAQLHLGKMHLYSVGEGYLSRFYREAKGLTYGAELEKIYGNYTKGNSNQNELNAILRSKLDYLKKQQEAGYNVQVIAPFEYEEFFGNNQKNNRITLLIIDIIAVIFVLAGFTKYEKNRGMHPLIRASCNRRSWLTTKWLASMIAIAVYIIINYSIYYVRLLGLYRLPELTVRVKSLEIFSWLPINPTVIGLIVIGVVIRIILVIVITGIVRCAYEK